MNQIFLAINRCPEHEAFWSISVDDEGGSGTRITPSKCCGRWNVVRKFLMSEADLKAASEVFVNAAEDAMADEPWLR